MSELKPSCYIKKRLVRAKLSTRLLHSKRYLIVLNGVLPTSEEPSVLSFESYTYKKRPLNAVFFLYGTPKRIRIAVYTVKGIRQGV